MSRAKAHTPKPEPVVTDVNDLAPDVDGEDEPVAKVHTKPTWEPFEVITHGKSKTSTWRHPNGATEQWKDDERVYGPE